MPWNIWNDPFYRALLAEAESLLYRATEDMFVESMQDPDAEHQALVQEFLRGR